MRDFYASRSAPLDQADGLRRLFSPTRTRYIAVASNPHVAFATVLIERLTSAIAASGRKLLLVDAAESAPEPHELTHLDLAAGIETLSPQIGYLAARGLPLRHVDTRGSCAGLLRQLADAAPQADVVLVHAGASELSRLFSHRAVRPVLLAADHPEDHDRYSPMVSRLLHLLIIDILTTGVALRLGPTLRPMLQEIKRNLRAKRYAAPGG